MRYIFNIVNRVLFLYSSKFILRENVKKMEDGRTQVEDSPEVSCTVKRLRGG